MLNKNQALRYNKVSDTTRKYKKVNHEEMLAIYQDSAIQIYYSKAVLWIQTG